MLGWFVFSAMLSFYNKFVFGAQHIAFPCPLLLTSIHFGAQWLFSASLCLCFPLYFGASRVTTMSWQEWLGTSAPCGFVTSGDIGLSNLSLVTISITFYTMIKAATPIFVLMWAYFFGLERITWTLVGVVFIIALGEALTVVGEVDFDLTGFLMCLTSSVLSGARWTLVQLKLQTMEPPLKTTIATMRLLAPSMFVSMFLMSMAFERPWTKFDNFSFEEALHISMLGILGAFFAISMILCEFYLIMYASAVILMIGGVIKEMITIFLGVTIFGDALNRINLAGCFIVFLGVVFYKISFHYYKDDDTKTYETSELKDDEECDSANGSFGSFHSREDLGADEGQLLTSKLKQHSSKLELRRLSENSKEGETVPILLPTKKSSF
jgi:solute carrier family 35 protein C2